MLKIIKEAFGFIKEIYQKKYLISELAKRDFKNRFTGSFLGIFWAFINPIVMLFILWFVFTQGFKAGNITDHAVPFFVWLMPAMIIWNFFSETFNSSTNVILEYSFLVKKVNFRLGILPLVKIMSALIIHGIFLLILFFVLILYGYYPDFYWFQFLYYLFCSVMLVLGLGWLTSALTVFIKDVGQIVGILLQFGFWLTPIFWEMNLVPEKYRFFFKFNPVWYLTEGYRKTFLYKVPLWEESLLATVYFWGVTFVFLFVGMVVFKKLRNHFADVI